MSPSPAPDSRRYAAAITLCVMGMMVTSIFHPDAIPFDHEELYNAAHARLLQIGHWKSWLDLQYRGHCGGCTQHALLGAGLFNLFGHSLFTWKLIPVIYAGLMAYTGARILTRFFGAPAAAIWGALLCFPAPTFLELSLTAWGNHVEAGAAAVVVLWAALQLRARPSGRHAGTLGIALAWALWIGFSSVFLVPALAVILWRRVRPKHLVLLGIGVLPIMLLWAYQHTFALSSPFETIYYTGETTPRISRIPEKLWSLFAPRQLIALFGDASMPVISWGVALSIVWSAWLSRHNPIARTFFWTVAAFLAVYSTVRFTVWAPPAPEIAPPGSMRYAAPLYGLLWLILAAGAGLAWSRRQRWLTVILIAPSLVAGITARTAHFGEPFPDWSVLRMAAPDFIYARDQAAYTLSLTAHRDAATGTEDGVAFHEFGIAWHETRALLDREPTAALEAPSSQHRAALEGIGAALLSEVDPTGQGGMRTLELINNRLTNFGNPSRVRVLAEAARRRDWTGPFRAGHLQIGIDKFQSSIQHLPDVAQEAMTEDLGRRWAADLTRWRTPQPIDTPAIDSLVYSASFVRGYAETIGRRIGDTTLPAPEAWLAHQSVWRSGLTFGHSLQWVSQSR